MRTRAGAIARWGLLALLGVVVAAAVGVASATLMSQQIGLSSEPLRAGEALTPPGEGAKPGRSVNDAVPAFPAIDPVTPTAPGGSDDLSHSNDHDHDSDDD